ADLDQITALQGPGAGRLPRNIDLPQGVQECLRAPQLDTGMLLLDRCVFEQVDIALLAAADRGHGLIEDELLSGQWPGSNVKPAVLECALYDPHGHAGGKAEKRKPDGTAWGSGVGCHCDRIENHATKTGSNDPSQDAVA